MRYTLEPDPAWDFCDRQDDVLVVELTWEPDALAARTTEIVASPALVAALEAERLTGYRTGAARGYYNEDAFDVEEGAEPPALVQLIVSDDPDADLSFVHPDGLTVSPRALAVLQAHCTHLRAEPVPPEGNGRYGSVRST